MARQTFRTSHGLLRWCCHAVSDFGSRSLIAIDSISAILSQIWSSSFQMSVVQSLTRADRLVVKDVASKCDAVSSLCRMLPQQLAQGPLLASITIFPVNVVPALFTCSDFQREILSMLVLLQSESFRRPFICWVMASIEAP